jgi:AcrR family transcriptional regulator
MSGAKNRLPDVEAGARRGRPRDPKVESRIKRAVLEAVAERGFAGLSVDLICSRAGVPRSTFYRRWSGAQEVLAEAFDEASRLSDLPDTGSLLGDLVAYATAYLEKGVDPVFRACLFYLTAQIQVDAELRQRLQPDFADRRAHNLRLIQRAIARGELQPGLEPDLILDAILGLLMAWAATGKSPSDEEVKLLIERLIAPDLRR